MTPKIRRLWQVHRGAEGDERGGEFVPRKRCAAWRRTSARSWFSRSRFRSQRASLWPAPKPSAMKWAGRGRRNRMLGRRGMPMGGWVVARLDKKICLGSFSLSGGCRQVSAALGARAPGFGLRVRWAMDASSTGVIGGALRASAPQAPWAAMRAVLAYKAWSRVKVQTVCHRICTP